MLVSATMPARFYILLASVLLASGALGSVYYHSTAAGGKTLEELLLPAAASVSDTAEVAALLAALPDTALAPPEKSRGCQALGPLPDPACSPGSVFADATLQKICVAGYTKGVRSVSVKLKQQVYAAYGIPYPQAFGSYELDHLIPLELGGDNAASNLFPEAAQPKPGFREKDVVEDYLHQEVCAGNLPLAAAQKQIAVDWLAVYQTLSPQTITSVKRQFHSWAD